MSERIEKAVKSPEGFFIVFLLVLELIFHVTRFGMTGAFILNKVFFATIVGAVIGLAVSALPALPGKILSAVFVCFFVLYYLVQLIYSSVFNNFFSLSATGGVADQALDYKSTILASVIKEIVPFLIYLIIMTASLIYIFKFSEFSRHVIMFYVFFSAFVATGIFYYIIILSVQGNDSNSPYAVFKTYSSLEMSIQKLGVLESMLRDGVYAIQSKGGDGNAGTDTGFDHEAIVKNEGNSPTGPNSKGELSEISVAKNDNDTLEAASKGDAASIGDAAAKGSAASSGDASKAADNTEEDTVENTEETTEVVKHKTYYAQVLDINLEDMSDITTNSSVLELNSYINSSFPTYSNDYTGMFEGYNLIFITAEGFDGFVIDKELTPELYKMSTKGFVFKNFYTPLWYGSTLGGEYANTTGLMPKNGGYLSMQKMGAQGNSMPFTLGNELEKQGYNVYAYHNNGYTYYDRHISRPYLGYENYKGVGNGLDYEKNGGGGMMWPQSDAFMEEITFDEFAGNEPFHVYYMTVSGHLQYNFGGNAMSAKNRDKVEELPYSEKTKAYIACQLEFELMMKQLNEDLEKKGIADKTLIVICGDHVPYDDMDIPNELAGRNLDSFECYRNSLIIYSASMETPVKVTKPCYSLDILPTVLNLMGLPYDSRMLVGKDILSDTPGMVIMPDGSFITESFRYSAVTGQATPEPGVDVTDTMIESTKSTVANRFRMAAAICELNYYKYVEELMEGN